MSYHEIQHSEISSVGVYQDKLTTAQATAKEIVAVVQKNPHAAITFATGNTMIPVYEELARAADAKEVDFSQIQAFHLDEYYPMSPDNPEGFVNYLYAYVFRPLHIDPRNIHVLDGTSDNPDKLTREYDALLAEKKPDVALLGIGPGGHIAFNEPGSVFNSRTRLARLSEDTIRRDRVDRGQSSPEEAMTQGIGTILEANLILLAAYGVEKGGFLQSALYGQITEEVPASALRLQGHKVKIFVDEAAANQMVK